MDYAILFLVFITISILIIYVLYETFYNKKEEADLEYLSDTWKEFTGEIEVPIKNFSNTVVSDVKDESTPSLLLNLNSK